MKYFYTKHKKNNAFTLIELLTVIAIIGFISVIVYANLQDAKKRAQATKIVEEMNQLSKAFELYKTDKGIYPGEAEKDGVKYQNNDAINYLNNTLVIPKYIPVIPEYGKITDIPDYTYYSGASLKSDDPRFNVINIICGSKVINDYIFIFENPDLKLDFQRLSPIVLANGDESTLTGYCIGQ